MEMNKRDFEAFQYFLQAWQSNWKKNQYYREWYDEDLEFYRGYRDKTKYPMSYSLSFNKLLPRVYTVMSRFMDQLYQAGTGDLISVRPRKRSDVERAPRVQGLLNYQLECLNDCDMRGGSYMFNFQWMFNAITFGKGIAKLYWKKEERVTPRRVTVPQPFFDDYGRLAGVKPVQILQNDMQVVYDGPYAEVIHNKLFNPDPTYRSIQQMPFVGMLYKKSLDYIKQKAKEGVFNGKYIKNLGWSGTQTSSAYSMDSAEGFAKSLEIEGALESEFEEITDGKRTPMVDIIEGYGRYIFPEDEGAYEVGSGYKIKGKESEAIVHIGNYKTILSLQKNTYGVRPFFDIGAYYHPELFWDIGIIRLGKDLQEQYNNMGNMRHENAMMTMHSMLKVKEDSDIDPAALIWKPFGIVPVQDMGDIEPLVVPDMFTSGAFREQENFFEETISDMTGMYPYNMGQTPQRQEKVGTIYSIQSMGEARTKLLLMTMDHAGFRPFLKYMMLLNTYHLDPETEARINTNMGQEFSPLFAGDYHTSYDFSARYTAMEPALGKQARAQMLLQLLPMFMQSPYTQHYQWQKAILELFDFHDSDRYLKTPDMVMKEQQMMAQQAAQAKLQEAQIEDQLAASQGQRDLTRDVVKGLLKNEGAAEKAIAKTGSK